MIMQAIYFFLEICKYFSIFCTCNSRNIFKYKDFWFGHHRSRGRVDHHDAVVAHDHAGVGIALDGVGEDAVRQLGKRDGLLGQIALRCSVIESLLGERRPISTTVRRRSTPCHQRGVICSRLALLAARPCAVSMAWSANRDPSADPRSRVGQ
jgi:hypothetical protein